MASDLLLEIGAEEIPARFVEPALQSMKEQFAAKAKESRLGFGEVSVYGTPRRLALLVKSVADRQEDLSREVLGPPVRVAYDAEGKPTQAAVKFAEGQGKKIEELQRLTTPKGEYVGLQVHQKGEAAEKLLPGLLQSIVAGIPFEKSMRWGTEEVRFVRPIHWICALHGPRTLKLQFGDVVSSNTTRGHRFLSPKPVKLASPGKYLAAMKAGHVMADVGKRRELIAQAVAKVAAKVGGKPIDDPALLDMVTHLVEDVTPVLGSFDASFLDLPSEVLISEMKGHQRYFPLVGEDGRLLPYFVAISNMPAKKLEVLRHGYERVLRARLADARFFFDEDRKRPLADRVEDLKRVVFQMKLGTSHEKMERFRELARGLAAELRIPRTAHVDRVATLCKADLTTGMVGEFPELQGIMGREYAKASGEPPEVAEGIAEHYLPRTAADALPKADPGAVVGIADRLDTLCGIFAIGRAPTGAADQFGLRRACLSIIRIVLERQYRFSLSGLVDRALSLLGPKAPNPAQVRREVLDFFRGRLKALWAEQQRPDVVEAVLSAGFDDLVAAHKRLQAMGALVGRPDFEPLAVAFKRVVNIVEKAKGVAAGPVDRERPQDPAERELYQGYVGVRERVDATLKADDYAGALREITSLKPAVDHFFDKVLVMAEDTAVRENRLRLLMEIAGLFARIADFSKIQESAEARATDPRPKG